MDILRDLFPEQPNRILELALRDSAQDLNQAINTLLAIPYEEPPIERVAAQREVIEIRSRSHTFDNQLEPVGWPCDGLSSSTVDLWTGSSSGDAAW
jgi:hypothetical protein